MTKISTTTVKIPSLLSFRSHRLRIAVLLMFALFHTVVMRVNLNMAIVATVDVNHFRAYWKPSTNFETQISNGSELGEEDNGGYNGSLQWVPPMQAILFSATFWGSITTVAFTGQVIQRIGAKAVLGVAIAVSIAVTVSTPVLSQFSFPALFAARVLMGAAESFVMPSIGAISACWIPPSERFALMELITSGNQLAASFSAVVTALLCLSPLGWQSVYYFYGIIATLWLLAWILLGANSPSESSTISESETKFIACTIPSKQSPGRIPWRSILTSRPLFACFCCQFAFVYSGTIMQGFLPTFLRDELRLPLAMNGLFTLIPFGTMLVMKTVFSLIARRLNESRLSTATKRAKLFQSISSIGCVISMVCIGFFASPDQLWIAISSLTVFGVSLAAAIPGFAVSTQSLSPQHSAIITQLSAIVAVVSGITAPMVMWLIMTLIKNGIVGSIWQTAFTFACSLNIAALLIFLLFGKVGDQGWRSEKNTSRTRIYSMEKVESGK